VTSHNRARHMTGSLASQKCRCKPSNTKFLEDMSRHKTCIGDMSPTFPAKCHTPTCAKMAKLNHVWPAAFPRTSRVAMSELGSERPIVPPAACHKPTCAKMAKLNHVWPTACPSRSVVMPELGSEHPECLQLPATHQHVPKWPTQIMFGPSPHHAPAG
jgi:hypothetical protein